MKIVDERMRDKLASESLSNPLDLCCGCNRNNFRRCCVSKNGAWSWRANVREYAKSRAAKGFAKGSLNEGASEGAEGGMQQYVTNTSSNEVSGTNIDPMQGNNERPQKMRLVGY